MFDLLEQQLYQPPVFTDNAYLGGGQRKIVGDIDIDLPFISFEHNPSEFQPFGGYSVYLDGYRTVLFLENTFGLLLAGLIDQYLGDMKITIIFHPDHKPDLLPGSD